MIECSECTSNIDKVLDEGERDSEIIAVTSFHFFTCKPCLSYYQLKIAEKDLHIKGPGELMELGDYLNESSK